MSAIRGVLALTITLLSLPAVWPAAATALSPAEPATTPAALRTAPVLFVENIGQFPPVVRFQARGGAGAWWFADDGIWLAVAGAADAAATPARLHLTFTGATPTAPRPIGAPAARVSYLLGADPAGWHAGATAWTGLRYDNLYPGLDLVIDDAGSGQLRWWWEARAGADPAVARLAVAGGDVQSVDAGRLRIATAAGDITLPLPAGTTTSAPHLVGGAVIAPVGVGSALVDTVQAAGVNDLLYATFLGGAGDDHATGVAVDGGGNAYVTGTTTSIAFSSLPASYDPVLSENGTGQDAFVAKVNATGSTLTYWTYLGGSSTDAATSIAVNAAGEVYVAGTTKSNAASGGFPTTDNAYQKPPQPGNDNVFVAVLDAEGTSLIYSTLLAGAGQDTAGSIAVGPDNQAYVAGTSFSADFPAKGGINKPGNSDVFIAKLNPASTSGPTSLVYSTFIGTTQKERNGVVAVDGSGAAYVAGLTEATAFGGVTRPLGLPGPFDKTYNGGFTDAFVAKLNPQGGLVYATLLGGSDEDGATAIAVDAAGANVYVTGYTNSHQQSTVPFPKAGGAFGGGTCPIPPTASRACFDIFVARLTLAATGANDLIAAALLGGAGDDFGNGIAADSNGRIYVTGETTGAGLPVTTNGYQAGPQGGRDAFALKLSPTLDSVRYGTYLGGSADDIGRAIALSGNTPYVVGSTSSANFPTRSGGYQTTPGGGVAGFVTKWAMPEDNPRPLAAPPATPTPTATAPAAGEPTPTTAPGQPTATPTATAPPVPATPTPLPTVGITATAKTWYFAEGYTGPGFDEYLTINNPGTSNGTATITYFVEGGAPVVRTVALPRNSRTTVVVHNDWHPSANPGGLGRLTVGHATRVVSDVPVIVERPMYFTYSPTIDGGHNVLGATSQGKTWYFAEGYTGAGFDEYLTILNPGAAGQATITYYVEGEPTPTEKVVALPENSRTTVAVHDASAPGGLGRNKAHATRVQTTVDTVVERPIYFRYGAGIDGGHNVVGSAAPSQTWYFAEGYTGPGFDEYLTINNPGTSNGTATITYFVEGGGPVQRTVALLASSRTTVTVHGDPSPANPGGLGRLAAGHATSVSSTVPVVVERPMYFQYGSAITGGHNVMGAGLTRTDWYFAEGYTGSGFDEYLTINNPTNTDGSATIIYFVEGVDPTKQPQRVVPLPKNSRTTVIVHSDYHPTTSLGGLGRLTAGHATRLISTVPVIVERPMYFTYNGSLDGGHNVLGYAP